MGIDNRGEDGGQKQQGGTQGSGPEGGRQVNDPGKSNNPNGQHERGSGSGDQTDQGAMGPDETPNQSGSGKR